MNTKKSLVEKFSDRYAVDGAKMFETLKATAFKQRDGSAPSNEQMMALLVVADQYKLNPFTREIYAFPDKQNGIVPVVGVDGWSRIINSHCEFDGMEFRYSDDTVTPRSCDKPCHEWVECVMYRKDRSRPVVVREYLDEVYREPFKQGMKGPWQTHTKRFLRHKAMIQCARLAFGFVGIYDDDEAQRIGEQTERDMGKAEIVIEEPAVLPHCPQETVEKYLPVVESGKKSASDVIASLASKYTLSDEQVAKLEKTA
ncbi:phage recombination protein Bet [Microbulbifer sp. TYP-18]|uniref:phage recombination protein Bet n=1 Tax=Microbulbifer sp. TYP-18 TaxID=3230024 RepID=UPI0034C6A311